MRDGMPTPAEIAAEYERVMQRMEAGEADTYENPIGVFNIHTDHEPKAGARQFDARNRKLRLAALRSDLPSPRCCRTPDAADQ